MSKVTRALSASRPKDKSRTSCDLEKAQSASPSSGSSTPRKSASRQMVQVPVRPTMLDSIDQLATGDALTSDDVGLAEDDRVEPDS